MFASCIPYLLTARECGRPNHVRTIIDVRRVEKRPPLLCAGLFSWPFTWPAGHAKLSFPSGYVHGAQEARSLGHIESSLLENLKNPLALVRATTDKVFCWFVEKALLT